MANRINFIKRTIESLPLPPKGKRNYFWDEEVHALCLDVSSSGRRTFYVRRKIDGVRHIVLIGEYPIVSIDAARAKALEICARIVKGEDPNKERKQVKAELTLGELFEAYMDGHAKDRCVAWMEIRNVLRRYLSDWQKRKLSTIQQIEVHGRMNYIKQHHGHTAANHCLTYARAAINWCIKSGLTTCANPWVGVPKFKTVSRDRFLKPSEMRSFFAALSELSNVDGMRDYFYLLLLTGARRSNVLAMRWEEVDLETQTWRIPRTKNGESQVVPLTSKAVEILRRRKEENKPADELQANFVFPGDGISGHIVEPKKAWAAVLASAGITDLRIHDLRRTLGSYMAMGNHSLHIIGKALGHRSHTSTQIYSRLTNDPVRAAMESAHTDMLLAAGLASDDNVVELQSKDQKHG